MYKTDMGILIKDIVGSKGYHVYKMWSQKKENLDSIVDRLNKKISDASKKEDVKKDTVVVDSFEQLKFEF